MTSPSIGRKLKVPGLTSFHSNPDEEKLTLTFSNEAHVIQEFK